MKKRLLAFIPLLGFIFATACANSKKVPEQDGFLGGWVASPQGTTIPEGASVFIGFWQNGTYSIITKFGGKESKTEGFYSRRDDTITFDGKTSYRYFVDTKSNTLYLENSDGLQTRYNRVQMELLPAE